MDAVVEKQAEIDVLAVAADHELEDPVIERVLAHPLGVARGRLPRPAVHVERPPATTTHSSSPSGARALGALDHPALLGVAEDHHLALQDTIGPVLTQPFRKTLTPRAFSSICCNEAATRVAEILIAEDEVDFLRLSISQKHAVARQLRGRIARRGPLPSSLAGRAPERGSGRQFRTARAFWIEWSSCYKKQLPHRLPSLCLSPKDSYLRRRAAALAFSRFDYCLSQMRTILSVACRVEVMLPTNRKQRGCRNLLRCQLSMILVDA